MNEITNEFLHELGQNLEPQFEFDDVTIPAGRLLAMVNALLALREQTRWRPMSEPPEDPTTPFLATLAVNIKGSFSHWERHIIAKSQDGELETDGIADDLYQGWHWDQYEFWMPYPPLPVTSEVAQ